MRPIYFGASLVALLALAGSAGAASDKERDKKKRKPARSAKTEEPAEPAPAAPEEEVPFGELRPDRGPKKVELGDDLVLDLPTDMAFFDRAKAKRILEAWGNVVEGNELRGMVLKKGATWAVTLEYVNDGYVKDDDAEKLDADEILKAIREGTEEDNEARRQRGFTPVSIDGWTEKPHYDRQQHHLIWGIKLTSQGARSDGPKSTVNFYTRVLGRRGYVALALLEDPAHVDAAKPEALAVLKATTFKPGARYADFDAKTDKVAEYGLAALVAGGAGAAALKFAKMGLLAKFGVKILALLVAGKKLVIVGLVGLVGAIKALLGWRKKKAEAMPPAFSQEQGPPTT